MPKMATNTRKPTRNDAGWINAKREILRYYSFNNAAELQLSALPLEENIDSFIFHTHITGKHSTTRVSETRAGSTILIPFFYSFADNQTQHDRALVLASICAICFEIDYTNIVEFIFFFNFTFAVYYR